MEPVKLYTPQHPLDGLVLIKDRLEADGGFLIPYTLHEALQEGLQVILVTLANSLAHYQYVLRKLGTNLPACMQSGKVRIVEALPETHLDNKDVPEDACLQLLDRIAGSELQGAEAGCASGGVCLIFDSLSALRCLHSSNAWRTFVHRVSMLGGAQSTSISCVVALVHADVADDVQWAAYLEHAAQVVIEVDALESGQSVDITGRMEVVKRATSGAAAQRDAQQPHMRALSRRLLDFKLADTGVRLMQCRAR